jgi:tetratricopeptide (TPR) repeat protein
MSSAGRQPARLDRWMLFIALSAVVIRLIYLQEGSGDPTLLHPIIDASEHDICARQLVEGEDPWGGPYTRPPLYVYLLFLVYRLFGFSIGAALTVQAILGGATCLLTCLLGARLFSRRVGLAAGVIVAFYGPMIFFDLRLVAPSLVTLCYLGVLLLAVRAASRPTWHNWLLLGVVTGIAALARPSIAPFFLLVPTAWIVVRGADGVVDPSPAYRERFWQGRLIALTCLAAGSMAPIIPVAVRNYRASGQFIPICTYGGANLYVGNNPHAEDTIALRPGPAWDRLMRLPDAEGMVSPREREAHFLGLFMDYVRRQPGDFFAGLARKARLYFNGREIPRNVDLYMHRQFSGVLSLLVWQIGSFCFPFGVLLPLGLVGMFVGGRRPPHRVLLVGYALACAVSVVVFFVAGRYRLPVVPVLAIFAVHAVFWLRDQISRARYRRAGGAGLVLVVLGLGVNLPAKAPADDVDFQADLLNQLGVRLVHEGRLPEAERAWLEAAEVAPDCAEIHYRLGGVVAQQGRSADALFHARRAIEIEPDLTEAHLGSGLALQDLGDHDAALIQFRRALAIEPGHPHAHHLLGGFLLARGQYAEGVKHLRWATHFDNRRPSHYEVLALGLTIQGQYQEAIATLDAASRRLESIDLTDALAWLLATCPEARLRSPRRAVALAQRAVRASESRNPIHLDTLAAAYAAAGRFEQAAESAGRAAQIARRAGHDDIAAAMSGRRALYLAGQPCRDPMR